MTIERLSAALADRYRIERELGQGGMATVYLAADLKHDRKVALKVLKPELAAVIGAERFVVEIKTTAALQHPHILPLFDSGTADGFLYYVMPFIDGETLRAKLDRETQLAVPEAVKLTVAVADALDYAHRHGVIHRDIKPENILLHDGRPMVADFGIALALSAAAGGRMTETGMSLGTPHYMSPEQATAEKEITGRSDIYSLGSVLYEMLAGQPPHLGGSAQQIIMKIIAEPVQLVTAYRRSVPANVAAAVAKSLEKLPADRFESAKAFADALQDSGFTIAGTAANPLSRPEGRAARLVPALSVLAVGALSLAAWGWLRSPGAAAATPWQTELALGEARFTGSASIAPDGSFLIYSAEEGGKAQLWLRRSGTLEPVPIAGTENGGLPAIAPDGRRVAFLATNGQVMMIPVEGGRATAVSTTPTNYWDKISWIDDDHLLFSSYGGLIRYSVVGEAPVQLTTVDSAAGEGLHGFPHALPDHRGSIFTIWPKGDFDLATIRIGVVGPEGGKHTVLIPGLQAIYVPPGNLIVLRIDGSLASVPFDLTSLRVTGPETPLGLSAGQVSANAAVGLPSVAANGRMIFSASGAGHRADLVRVSRTGAVLEVDSTWPGVPTSTNVSPDGTRIASVVIAAEGDVWDVQVKEVRTGAMIHIPTPGVWDQFPTFSHDGRTLIFIGSSGQRDVIYRTILGRVEPPEHLIESEPGSLLQPALSPDGATLYYSRRGDILAHRMSASNEADRVVVGTNATESAPAPSPDGRWLAYISDEGEHTELYVRSTDPSRAERWQVSTAGASAAFVRWSNTGTELYYVAHDSVMAARTSSGTVFTITGRQALFAMGPYDLRGSLTPLPSGAFLVTRPRRAGAQYRLMMVDDWKALRGRH